MPLFLPGPFVGRSGRILPMKVECEALTPADWSTIAAAVVPKLPPFGAVWGVPRGGYRFADALRCHHTSGADLAVICDDVFTTGGSLLRHVEWMARLRVLCTPWIGLVLFARGGAVLPPNVRAVCRVEEWVDGPANLQQVIGHG